MFVDSKAPHVEGFKEAESIINELLPFPIAEEIIPHLFPVPFPESNRKRPFSLSEDQKRRRVSE